MNKEPKYYLQHILDSIELIQEYTFEFDIDKFLQNKLVQDAVIRNFEIIGEATKKLDNTFREKHSDIEWKKISGMRDKLIHDYLGVDIFAVWRVIEQILPDLKSKIQLIISSND
jgi:uncharacterized protein with HEPN domain